MSGLLEVAEVAVAAALIPMAILAHEGTHLLAARAFGVPGELSSVFPRPMVSIPADVPELPLRVIALAPTLAAVAVVATLDTVGVPIAGALARTALAAYVALLSPSLSTIPDFFVATALLMFAWPSLWDLAPRTMGNRKQSN